MVDSRVGILKICLESGTCIVRRLHSMSMLAIVLFANKVVHLHHPRKSRHHCIRGLGPLYMFLEAVILVYQEMIYNSTWKSLSSGQSFHTLSHYFLMFSVSFNPRTWSEFFPRWSSPR